MAKDNPQTLGRPKTNLANSNPYDFVTREEVKNLSVLSPFKVLADSLTLWVLVFGMLFLWIKTQHPAVFALAFFVIATRQLALTHLIHEASHFNILRNKKWNDIIADFLYAGPVGFSTAAYPNGHAPHHLHLGQHDK